MNTFADKMNVSGNFKKAKFGDKWDILAKKYHNHTTITKTAIIPKIIHQIWLGGEVPKELLNLIESIKKVNIGYKHFLWDDKSILNFEFKNKDLFFRTPNLGQRSDILRYAILEKYGGIYLDADFKGYKSFDELLGLDFFAGLAYDEAPVMFNGLIGSTPNNRLIQDLNIIETLKWNDGMDVIETTGPYFLTRKVFKHIDTLDNICALPVTYFYPFPNFSQDRCFGDTYESYVKPETICLHLWHSRWN